MAKKDAFEPRRKQRRLQTVKRPYLVVCEGLKTEPLYFNYLTTILPLETISLKVISARGGGARVVEKAMEYRDQYKEIWCVFDHEGIHSNPDDFEKAVRLADELGFELAVSNPTFELWYLFHLIPISPNATAYRSPRDVIAALEKQMGSPYRKGDVHFAAKVLQRARTDLPTLVSEASRAFPYSAEAAPSVRCVNPMTHVYRLVSLML